MSRYTVKVTSALIAAFAAGMLTALAWRYGYLQILVAQQLAQPAWAAPVFGAIAGVICTSELWTNSLCKYFAATMTVCASILLGGFFWATTHFGYWEAALRLADSVGPFLGPWLIAGAGTCYMFYVSLVMVMFSRPVQTAKARVDSQ